LNDVKTNYCGDALINSKGTLQVASFTSAEEAGQLAQQLTNATGAEFRVGTQYKLGGSSTDTSADTPVSSEESPVETPTASIIPSPSSESLPSLPSGFAQYTAYLIGAGFLLFILVLWFLPAILAYRVAAAKGCSKVSWCVAAVFFGPAVFIATLGLPDRVLRKQMDQLIEQKSEPERNKG